MVLFVSACSSEEAAEQVISYLAESESSYEDTSEYSYSSSSESSNYTSEEASVSEDQVSKDISEEDYYESDSSSAVAETVSENTVEYHFRNSKLLNQHYEKHGIEMGYDSPEAYEEAASNVINDPSALHKTESEDGDYVYYIESTNEFVILSTDGYIRTYFYPSAGKAYYDRQ